MNLSFLRYFIPCRQWPRAFSWRDLSHDLEAGAIGALLVLPQAISLAMLAGMPVEYGIYTSIVPVMVAALWGASWHQVSGPNTAVCVLLAATVAPLAMAGSPDYIGYVLLLTLMVGLVQLLAGLLRAGALFDFVSASIVLAIVQAVASMILISAASGLLGVDDGGGSLLARLADLASRLAEIQPWVATVGMVTLVTGLLARRWMPRYALILALLAGGVGAWFLNRRFGMEYTGIRLLGELELAVLPLSLPPFEHLDVRLILDFAGAALAIAFLGAMQTLVIARSLAARGGQRIDANQEVVAQGLANLVAPFVSAFAGSGSFNRSAANHAAGARSPLAAVLASLLLIALVMLSGPLIAQLPIAAVAGTLVLVAIGLFDGAAVRRVLGQPGERWVFLVSLAVALLWGLSSGLAAGLLVSLGIYLWHTSRPQLMVSRRIAGDGRETILVELEGSLFFGSVPAMVQRLEQETRPHADDDILVIDIDRLGYLDLPGAGLLTQVLDEHRRKAGEAYVIASRATRIGLLEQAGLFQCLGRDHLIDRDRDHPAKAILYPYPVRQPDSGARASNNRTRGGTMKSHHSDLETLAERLRSVPLFGPIGRQAMLNLLRDAPLQRARDGAVIVRPDECLESHIVLLEGELEACREWTDQEGHERSHRWSIRALTDKATVGVLGAASRHLRARAVGEVCFLHLDADRVDEHLAWAQQLEGLGDEPHQRDRGCLLRQVGAFHHLPPERLAEVLGRMRQRRVEAGEIVVREGGEGDAYFLIEEGEAEVIRSDPFSGETRVVDHMETGEGFGEEALLQKGYRNATIRMLTPGRLLVLRKEDFSELLEPALLDEIDADRAWPLILNRRVRLLDCRYDMEYEESRIPDAELVPLHRLRFETHRLDPDQEYIVYCRSGRRSRAAAFLLRERNFKACSLSGGIQAWPFAIDAEPLEVSSGG